MARLTIFILIFSFLSSQLVSAGIIELKPDEVLNCPKRNFVVSTDRNISAKKGIKDGDLIINSGVTLTLEENSTLYLEKGHIISFESGGKIRANNNAKIIIANFTTPLLFKEDFDTLTGWAPLSQDKGTVVGREGDVHHSYIEWDTIDGVLTFAKGDFIGLDLASEIDIPAGAEKLILEFDTKLGGTWCHSNNVELLDSKGKPVIGGGIVRCDYGYNKGEWETNCRLNLCTPGSQSFTSIPQNALTSGTWYHIKVIFDKGTFTIKCGDYKFTKTTDSTTLPEIKKIHISGWQHTKGAQFDSIRIIE